MQVFIHQLNNDRKNEDREKIKEHYKALKQELLNAISNGKLSSDWLNKIKAIESV